MWFLILVYRLINIDSSLNQFGTPSTLGFMHRYVWYVLVCDMTDRLYGPKLKTKVHTIFHCFLFNFPLVISVQNLIMRWENQANKGKFSEKKILWHLVLEYVFEPGLHFSLNFHIYYVSFHFIFISYMAKLPWKFWFLLQWSIIFCFTNWKKNFMKKLKWL